MPDEVAFVAPTGELIPLRQAESAWNASVSMTLGSSRQSETGSWMNPAISKGYQRIINCDAMRMSSGFSMACAGLELARFICMLTAPSGIADQGAQHYNLTTGTLLLDDGTCKEECPYSSALFGLANDVPVQVTGRHGLAEHARLSRSGRSPAKGLSLPLVS